MKSPKAAWLSNEPVALETLNLIKHPNMQEALRVAFAQMCFDAVPKNPQSAMEQQYRQDGARMLLGYIDTICLKTNPPEKPSTALEAV
jgi:hypothetical protein